MTRQPEITTLEAAARSPLLIVYFALGIAPDNIRRRLKRMCGGTLEIEEREAGGTRMTIFIPLDMKGQNG